MSVVSESAVALQHGGSVAVFLGIQQSGVPGIPDLPLYNLTRQVGHHPAGSTVSAATLERHGYSAPAHTGGAR
ncbi:MAG: hypothetical protein WC205_04070 [Opitutaceae bacterium]